MPDLFIYLLKANVALCLFYLAYRLGLRRLTFYTLNRFFLVTGIVFSSVFPLVDVNDFFNRNEKALEGVVYYVPDINALKAVPAEDPFTVWNMLAYAFWAGVAVMGIRLLFQLLSLAMFHLRSNPASVQDTPVRVVQREMSPFSFFKNIYINPSMHSHEELDAVIQHESIHVKEWHSADVMMGEINNVFYWFNPGAWLMKTAIRENLEFITDRRMLRAGVDPKVYQYSLLKVSGAPYATAIANNFNFSHLKNRIMMMNKERSSRYQVVRYAILGCMVSMLVLTLNFSRAGVKLAPVGEGTIPQLIVDRLDGAPKDTTPAIERVYSDTLPIKFFTSKTDTVINAGVRYAIRTLDSASTAGKHVTLNFVAAMDTVRPVKLQGVVTYAMDMPVIGNLVGKLSGVQVDTVYGTIKAKPAGKQLEDVVVTGFPLAGRVAGVAAVPGDEVVITKRVNGQAIQVQPRLQLRGVRSDSGVEPDYYINNRKVDVAEFRTLDPNKIESVSVLKDIPTSLNGRIMVITKDNNQPVRLTYAQTNGVPVVTDEKQGISLSASNIQIRYDSARAAGQNPVFRVVADKKPNLLYVVNGKVDSTALLHLDGNRIKSISVVKSDAAKVLYGRNDVDGVLFVETKPETITLENIKVDGKPVKKGDLEEVTVVGYASPRVVTTSGSGSLKYVTADARNANAVSIKPATLEGFNVFPNPSEGVFNVTFNAGKGGRFELAAYTISGDMKYQYKGTGNGVFKGKIDLSPYPAGSYVISVIVDGIKHSKTVIKK